MMWIKGCPKCGGDLFEEHVDPVPDIKCLQCSRVLNEAQRRYVLTRTKEYWLTRARTPAVLRAAS